MPFVDLSHPIKSGMPVYPGTEGPKITQACSIDANGFAEKLIGFYSHTGTHMDAPSHLIADGPDLDNYAIDTFQGRGVCIDLQDIGQRDIGVDDLAVLSGALDQAEYLLVHTGWCRHWGRAQYFEQHPVLSADAARWLTRFDLKAVGFDNISADRFDTKTYPIHKILLGSGTLIIENLAHLDRLPPIDFQLFCLPLNLSGADGAPVRVVAEF